MKHATPAHGNEWHDAEADYISYLKPLQLPKQKSQNDYLGEWLPHQQQYLDVLLAQEAPPDPRTCNICGGDATTSLESPP
ncbi:hypothetical protein PAXRUDRAFT_22409 [Paxillus rubicundulus Ve08.2h10]|uniref:Uncharacterized protein n=1 Tax=Paxillus rubicundulus Ve08.2h10 TaxID=930991 RepID=A0A0D0C8X9_9AGAM|nr:hypothetical protein PAXRUDRAFT_22409 [Paxillus rubicundulus Ve08.2h10]